MKYLVLIMAITLAGCCDHKDEKKVEGNATVQRTYDLKFVEDKERGVTCYFIYTDHLSCIKTKKSLKEEVEEAQLREILGIKEEK